MPGFVTMKKSQLSAAKNANTILSVAESVLEDQEHLNAVFLLVLL